MRWQMGAEVLNRSAAEEMVLLSVHAAGAEGRLGSELRRDLYGFVSHQLSPGEWRSALDDLMTALLDGGQIEIVNGKRMRLARPGEARLAAFCGGKLPKGESWPALRNRVLVAKALDTPGRKSLTKRALESAGDLRAAILERAFKLKLKPGRSSAEIRRQLAGKAKIGKAKTGATKTGATKTGATKGNADAQPESDRRGSGYRQLAARLLKSRRPVDSDNALIRQLAAEQVGSLQTDATALRIALLRRLMANDDQPINDQPAKAKSDPAKPATPKLPQRPPALPDFARVALEAARGKAEGWAGNRRAFVSRVWDGVSRSHTHWGLDAAGFKAMLVDAHRQGLLSLTNADVRDKSALPELEASAIQHANSVWHYIRVES